MTDKEILDHMQRALDRRRSGLPFDMDFAGIVFTITPGGKKDLRQIMTEAIRDGIARQVANDLKG